MSSCLRVIPSRDRRYRSAKPYRTSPFLHFVMTNLRSLVRNEMTGGKKHKSAVGSLNGLEIPYALIISFQECFCGQHVFPIWIIVHKRPKMKEGGGAHLNLKFLAHVVPKLWPSVLS